MVYKHPLKGEQLHDMMRSIAESLQLYGLESWCCRSMTLICRASIHFVPHPHFWLSALSLNFSSLSLSLFTNPSILSLLVSNYHAVWEHGYSVSLTPILSPMISFPTSTGATDTLATVDEEHTTNRFNDAKCDRLGVGQWDMKISRESSHHTWDRYTLMMEVATV